MQISTDPDADFSPASFTIRLQNRAGNPFTTVDYQNLGGGQVDASMIDQTTLGKITYASPGVYMPRFVVTDTQVAPLLPTAVASWRPPQTGSVDTDIAEYTVRRVISGVKRVYFHLSGPQS